LGGLEGDLLRRRDIDLGASGRIAADAGRHVLHRKLSDAWERHFISLRQQIGNDVLERFEYRRGGELGLAAILCDASNEIGFGRHVCPLGLMRVLPAGAAYAALSKSGIGAISSGWRAERSRFVTGLSMSSKSV